MYVVMNRMQLCCRDFKAIARHMGGTRSMPAVRAYFTKQRKRLGLNKLLQAAAAAASAAAAAADAVLDQQQPAEELTEAPAQVVQMQSKHCHLQRCWYSADMSVMLVLLVGASVCMILFFFCLL